MAWERQLDCLQREGLCPRALANLECNAPMGGVTAKIGVPRKRMTLVVKGVVGV